jgi:hypothetical protein
MQEWHILLNFNMGYFWNTTN